MQPLSAGQAVSPAFARTKLVLFAPFRMGRSWKLAATGYASPMGTFFFPFPLMALGGFSLLRQAAGVRWAWAGVVGVLLLTCFFGWIFWLCSQLQFAFLDVVANRSQFIAPLWRQYCEPARRWSRFKIVIGLGVSVPLLPLIGLCISHITKAIQAAPANSPATFSIVFSMIIGFVLLYAVFALLLLIVSLINDFMVPPMALENLSIAQAWSGVVELVRRDPGQVALYAVLKVALGMAGQMALNLAFQIVGNAVMFPLVAVGIAIGVVLHAIGIPVLALQIVGIGIMVVVMLALFFYAMVFGAGMVMTFLEAYKLCFLGGRYPRLGDLLDRSTPPPAAPLPLYYAYSTPPEPVATEPAPPASPPLPEE